MPKCSLYGRSALIGNKDLLNSRKIRSYYIERPKTPICTIVIVVSSLLVVSNHLKFQKLLDFKLRENFSKIFSSTSLKQLGKKFLKGILNLKHVSKISNSSLNTSRAFSNVKDRSEAKSKEQKNIFRRRSQKKKSKGLRSHNKSYYYKEGCL